MSFSQNTKGQDYVVGDLHGHFDLLQEGLQKIDFNPDVDRLFSVGDLIDRGTQSVECMELAAKPWFHAVRGNHEEMMLEATYDSEQKYLWVLNGGGWHQKIPASKLMYLRMLARQLPFALTVETKRGLIGICHAEPASDNWEDSLNPVTPEHKQTMLWERTLYRLATTRTKGVYLTIHGHTPLKKIHRVGNALFIDTGAYNTGNLTILNLGDL